MWLSCSRNVKLEGYSKSANVFLGRCQRLLEHTKSTTNYQRSSRGAVQKKAETVLRQSLLKTSIAVPPAKEFMLISKYWNMSVWYLTIPYIPYQERKWTKEKKFGHETNNCKRKGSRLFKNGQEYKRFKKKLFAVFNFNAKVC